MRFLSLGVLTLFSASLSYALPTELKEFFLVTTDQRNPSSNSSNLKAVSATSLFDPYYQPALLLRLTGPGYGSLPNFTLTDGTLQTYAYGPHGVSGPFVYNSSIVQPDVELQFLAAVQPAGNLALNDGYLLTVGGKREGWTLCDGQLYQEVLFWKGTDASCKKTYVHAVKAAPY